MVCGVGVGIVIGCRGGGLRGCMVGGVCVFVDGCVSAGKCDVCVGGVSAGEW